MEINLFSRAKIVIFLRNAKHFSHFSLLILIF